MQHHWVCLGVPEIAFWDSHIHIFNNHTTQQGHTTSSRDLWSPFLHTPAYELPRSAGWQCWFLYSETVILEHELHPNHLQELLTLITKIIIIIITCFYGAPSKYSANHSSRTPSSKYTNILENQNHQRWGTGTTQMILIYIELWKQLWKRDITLQLSSQTLGMSIYWWTEGLRCLEENLAHPPKTHRSF